MKQWNTPSANTVSERVFFPLFDHKSGVSVPVGTWRCQLFMSSAAWILDQLRTRHRSPEGLRAPALFPSKENSLTHLNGADDSYSDARTPPCIGRWDVKGTEKMGKREGIKPYSKIWFRTRRKWLLYNHFILSQWDDFSLYLQLWFLPVVLESVFCLGCLSSPPSAKHRVSFSANPRWDLGLPLGETGTIHFCRWLSWVGSSLRQGFGGHKFIQEVNPGNTSGGRGKWDKEGRQPVKRCYQAPTWTTRVYTPEELYCQWTKVLESSQLEWGSWVFVYHTLLAILWGCFSSPHPGCVRHVIHNLCFLKKTPSCR